MDNKEVPQVPPSETEVKVENQAESQPEQTVGGAAAETSTEKPEEQKQRESLAQAFEAAKKGDANSAREFLKRDLLENDIALRPELKDELDRRIGAMGSLLESVATDQPDFENMATNLREAKADSDTKGKVSELLMYKGWSKEQVAGLFGRAEQNLSNSVNSVEVRNEVPTPGNELPQTPEPFKTPEPPKPFE